MARIYSHDGYIAADGLTDEEAASMAERFADTWDETVDLEDSAGCWYVFPCDATGVRPERVEVAEGTYGADEPDDWAVCDRCGQHAVHHSEGCR